MPRRHCIQLVLRGCPRSDSGTPPCAEDGGNFISTTAEAPPAADN